MSWIDKDVLDVNLLSLIYFDSSFEVTYVCVVHSFVSEHYFLGIIDFLLSLSLQ